MFLQGFLLTSQFVVLFSFISQIHNKSFHEGIGGWIHHVLSLRVGVVVHVTCLCWHECEDTSLSILAHQLDCLSFSLKTDPTSSIVPLSQLQGVTYRQQKFGLKYTSILSASEVCQVAVFLHGREPLSIIWIKKPRFTVVHKRLQMIWNVWNVCCWWVSEQPGLRFTFHMQHLYHIC